MITLANSSKFDDAFLSEPLTAYALGWDDEGELKKTLDFIAPTVFVPRRFEYRRANNPSCFVMDKEDIRAIGAEFPVIEPSGEIALGKTHNKGLSMRIDLDQVSTIPNWRQIATARLLRSLMRMEIYRAITALVAAAHNTAVTWDTTAGKDPDTDVMASLKLAIDSSGCKPNRVLYGDDAWSARVLSHRAQSTAGGFASASLTTNELARILGVKTVHVNTERYQATPTTKSGFAENKVILFNAHNSISPEDPSNIKRFVTPCGDGNAYRVYEHNVSGKICDITVEHYSNIVVTCNLGIETLTVSTS